MKALLRYFLNYLCSTVLLMLPVKLYAQHSGLKVYNVNDGLPGTSINGAYQDNYGYLWVCTPGGLSRFDGRQFVNYSLADGLPSLNVIKIFQDSRERLWVGTATGMAQFKNNRFINYSTNDSLNNFYVFNFIEREGDKIWALTGKGVYEFADSVWEKVPLYPGYENSMCRGVIELNGELYATYKHNIFCKTKEGKWLHIATLQKGSIFNYMSVHNKQIWVSTNNNICKINDHQLVPLYKNNVSGKSYFSYLVDSKNRLWLAAERHLKISKPGEWQHLFYIDINQYGYASGINEDSNHNIWIGTEEGLLKIKDTSYTIVDKNNTAQLDGIYNIIPLTDNRLIFSSGTKTGLLLYSNNTCKQIMPPPSPGNEYYYEDPVDAYTFDDKKTLWMITRFKKFLHFDGKMLKDFSGFIHFKTTEIIYDLDYDKNRHQFFICADSTLLYGSSSKLSTFIPHNTGVPVIKPTRIHQLKNGLLLLFVYKQGLYYIDAANNLIGISQPAIDSSSKNIASDVSFCEVSNNDFWMAVPGLGLYEYGFAKNSPPFLKNHITIKDGLQSDNILSLASDRQNRLWVATSTGLDILQPGKAGGWEVFNYATTDELTFSGSYYERLVTDTSGTVWLSSPNKILKFNSADIKLSKEAPHIIIEKVSLAFKETDWSKLADSLYSYYQLPFNPILNYNQNSLSLFFNAIDLSTTKSDPQYSYKLLPLDTAWSVPSKTKTLSFAQLPAGKYQFFVRAKDMASTWSQPAVFKFAITPPFWNEWWFRLTIIAIASFIVINIFQGRVKKIKRDALIQNQLKELEMKALKAQMNPHFIYNALNSIQALIANDKKEEGIRYIGSFSRLLRQVLDNSENNTISLDKELETIGLYIQLEALRLDMQLQYKKNISENIVTEFEKLPPLILQPFIENALWHGLSHKEGTKEIVISVNTKDDFLICKISDNGIGRVKSQEWKSLTTALHQSKGIDITRKRLIDFNEDDLADPIEFFDLYDEENNPAGTSVSVRIKRKGSLYSV